MLTMKIPTLDNEIIWNPQPNVEYEWIENHTFNGWLTFMYMQKANNKIKYVFSSHDGTKKYQMFPEDLEPMINHIDRGKVAGSFEFVKRGKSYGIRLVHATF